MGVAQRLEIKPCELKFELTTGRIFVVESVRDDDNGEWTNVDTDVTDKFKCEADLKNIRVGWISFIKGVGRHIWADGPPDKHIDKPTMPPGR